MHKVSVCISVAVSFALVLILFITAAQNSSAGPIGQICFDEGCCYIGARAEISDCSRGLIACAKHLSQSKLLKSGIYTWSSSSVGSIRECSDEFWEYDTINPLPEVSALDTATFIGVPISEIRKKMQELNIENIAQRRIEKILYSSCLQKPQSNLDKLRCDRFLPASNKIRSLTSENLNLTKDILKFKTENDSLKTRVKQLERENENLKDLWGRWIEWVETFSNQSSANQNSGG